MKISRETTPVCPQSKSPRFPALLRLVVGASVALPLVTAQAAFHLWDVNEVYSSADGTVQFIELRALFGGQQSLNTFGATIRSTNSSGVNTFAFPTNLPSDTANKFCILGTANLASIPGGVTPNYIIPANFVLPPVGGGNAAVIFVPNPGSPAAYTTLPTDGDSSLLRSGATMIIVPTNSARNFSDQSNTIVPVKFLTASGLDTNFVMTFRTATGPNGSAGPNYGVEFKDRLTSANWSNLANVAGDGTTKSVTNPLASATQRFFRLRVP